MDRICSKTSSAMKPNGRDSISNIEPKQRTVHKVIRLDSQQTYVRYYELGLEGVHQQISICMKDYNFISPHVAFGDMLPVDYEAV